jgi:CubicO group peptidase (beta-lactamase class C family)
LDQGDKRPLNADTIFEIGSVTKVFTSLLLADMAARGEVALTDPVEKYLPAGVKVPHRAGQAITLQDLATHTSGLPREPPNFGLRWPEEADQLFRVSILDVQTFKADLVKREAAPKTINRRISSVSSFYKYLGGAAAELRLRRQ